MNSIVLKMKMDFILCGYMTSLIMDMNRLNLDKLKHENIFSDNIIEDAKEFIFGSRKYILILLMI